MGVFFRIGTKIDLLIVTVIISTAVVEGLPEFSIVNSNSHFTTFSNVKKCF